MQILLLPGTSENDTLGGLFLIRQYVIFFVSFLCSFSFDLISVFNFFLYFFEVVSAAFILASANVERDSAKAVW